MSRKTLVVHAALTTAATLFSINYIISKVAMQAFTPFVFAYLRIVGAAIVLLVWSAVARGGQEPLSRADRRQLLLFSLLGVVINQTFFLGGLALTTAHVAAILITTIPIFAHVAAIVLGRERATALRTGGIAMAAVGATLVIGFEGFDGTPKAVIGDLMIVINSLSYALYLVLSKPMMARLSSLRVLTMMFSFAAVILLPAAVWPLLHEPWGRIGAYAWLSLAAVVAGPTVAAYLLNGWALGQVASSVVAAYAYLQPVMTVVLAASLLGETIRPAALVAGTMIIIGVYLASA